jgi:hypothetical protein
MADNHIVKRAIEFLPDPKIYKGNYIDINVPLKNGMHDVVTFMKAEENGVLVWMALPYAR